MHLKLLPLTRLYSQLKMNINTSITYEAAMDALNKLQTNADYLKKVSSYNAHDERASSKLDDVRKFLSRIGLTMEKLDSLSVIHVAGTKGKGTTCALCESILRHHGYKTGFFSSPHLVEVRERIRINGQPISREDFAYQFFDVYNTLQNLKDNPDDMPLYFRFLVIMAFQYFLQQEVDVAILEVGIGGEYDCTNVLRKVPVVGITSLGIDHTEILGKTLEAIAWQKGGIMKEGCQAFTVEQPEEAMRILKARSIEKKCTLHIINDYQDVYCDKNNGLPKDVLKKNTSLAIAMANSWIKTSAKSNTGFQKLCPNIIKKAIENCVWPGRFDIRQQRNIRYFLDGAHTLDSIIICKNWYNQHMMKNFRGKKALLFNVTGKRDPVPLLSELIHCSFHVVLFVGNTDGKYDTIGNSSISGSPDASMEKCKHYKEIWMQLEKTETSIRKAAKVQIHPSVLQAIESLDDFQYSLLVTGSVHLIGCVLNIIDPHVNNNGNNV